MPPNVPTDPPPPGDRMWSSSPLTRYAGLGIELGAAIGGGALLGYWIDRKYGTAPVALLVGVSIGMVGGMYNLIRQALQMMRADERKRRVGEARPKHDEETRG